jgi:oligopeptide transport system substrate-binding protein
MRRNPHWHGSATVKLAGIQFIRFDSGEAEERAFRTGQVDVTMAVPENKVPVYTREQPDVLHRAPMIETRYLSFNTQRAPLTDPRVRRALALAINAPRIAERVTRGGQHAATRLLPPALRASPKSTPLEHEFRYDPDLARKLFAEAGMTGATFPKLELSAWSNTPVLETVQAMWKQELGIDVAIVVRDARVHLSSLAHGDYDIGFITAIPDVADPANLLADFLTGAPENYPQWSDAAFDRAFAVAMSLAAEPARGSGLERAETRLLEAAPVAPLYFNTKVWLMSPRVRGWQEDGLWSRTYHEIYLADE